MRRLLTFLAVPLFSAVVFAGDPAGTSGFTFLAIPVGARATAMGQAFTSVPNDVQGMAYNPAILGSLIASQISLQHLTYVEGITQESIAFGKGGESNSIHWGASLNYFRVGGITRTVATNSSTGDGFLEQGDFSTYDMALGLTGAKALTDEFFVGGTAKLLRESLADATSTGAAFDGGVLYRGGAFRSWNVGASILNLGHVSRFSEAAVPLPTSFRVGVSAKPFVQWLLSADYVKRRDTKGEFDVGAEVSPRKAFCLRFGYRYTLTRPDLGTLSDFSAGFGIRPGSWSVDYAFVPLGDLGLTHRISLNLRFKKSKT